MLALSFLLVAVFLLLKWFYKPTKISRASKVLEHKCDGFLAAPDRQPGRAVDIASYINILREKSSNKLLFSTSEIQRYLLVRSGLNNMSLDMSLDMPDSVLSLGQAAVSPP